jgi:hypothetical protein
MTFAELVLLVGGGAAIYVLLRPLQRWLERVLITTFSGRHPRERQTTIDVTDFRSYPSRKKEDHDQHGF